MHDLQTVLQRRRIADAVKDLPSNTGEPMSRYLDSRNALLRRSALPAAGAALAATGLYYGGKKLLAPKPPQDAMQQKGRSQPSPLAGSEDFTG